MEKTPEAVIDTSRGSFEAPGNADYPSVMVKAMGGQSSKSIIAQLEVKWNKGRIFPLSFHQETAWR